MIGVLLKKLPVLTMGGLSLCLIVAACGHSADQRVASTGVWSAAAPG